VRLRSVVGALQRISIRVRPSLPTTGTQRTARPVSVVRVVAFFTAGPLSLVGCSSCVHPRVRHTDAEGEQQVNERVRTGDPEPPEERADSVVGALARVTS